MPSELEAATAEAEEERPSGEEAGSEKAEKEWDD